MLACEAPDERLVGEAREEGDEVGALGGRIWAASDGPGRGAALHLLVPLTTRDTALAGAT